MRESILPRMQTVSQDTVLGGIHKHVNDNKMVIVLGEPGEGKTITVLDYCLHCNRSAYYYRCSPNTTMNSLLIFIANAIGVRIVGGNDEVQNRIQQELVQNPNYCFVFDEAEYLAYGNGSKIDVLRQIFDSTDVPIILCGTYDLKDLLSGEKKKSVHKTHNRPQIFRRLRKEEFTLIQESEIFDYLTLLEKEYAVSFENRVKTRLINMCRDRQNGGIGTFIETIELLFSEVRPEWKDISYQIIEETNRILHTHTETAQTFTAIKLDKYDLEKIEHEQALAQNNLLEESPTPPRIHIDVSSLEIAKIDYAILQDSLNHKMTK